MLGEELPCIRYDGWGNLTPSGYFKFDLGVFLFRVASSAIDPLHLAHPMFCLSGTFCNAMHYDLWPAFFPLDGLFVACPVNYERSFATAELSD